VSRSPSIDVRLQVAAPAVGSALASAFPALSSARHAPGAQHDMDSSSPGSTFCRCHAAPPPVGLALASVSPASSTATHRLGEEHETAVSSGWLESMLASCQDPDPGLVLVSTLPALSTATHSVAVGQEMSVSALPGSIDAGEDHVDALAPRLTSTFPWPSTATHGAPGGQEMAVKDWPESTGSAVQVGFAAVGSVVLSACPTLSTATQSDSDAHDTALGIPPAGNDAGSDQASEGAALAGVGASKAPRSSASASRDTTALIRLYGSRGRAVLTSTNVDSTGSTLEGDLPSL